MIGFVIWLAEKIKDVVEDEYYDPENIKQQIIELSDKLDSKEITESEYREIEGELLERLSIAKDLDEDE